MSGSSRLNAWAELDNRYRFGHTSTIDGVLSVFPALNGYESSLSESRFTRQSTFWVLLSRLLSTNCWAKPNAVPFRVRVDGQDRYSIFERS